MADYVYSTVPGKIKTLLSKIREVGVPPKVTGQWLKTIGFTSSNDASLIGVLKFIQFIDTSGSPTARWTQFRGGSYKQVLGQAISQSYSELYAVYPDAHARSRTDLENVFSTSTKGGKEVVGKLVSTFKTLAEDAEFSEHGLSPDDLQVDAGPLHAPVTSKAATKAAPGGNPSLHIDVQIHISAEAGPEQIEQIFASMAKHLYGKG